LALRLRELCERERFKVSDNSAFGVTVFVLKIWRIETRDGKKYDAEPRSQEMTRLNKSFAAMHGISSLLNMGGFIATVWYGFSLAARIH
jgi:hypothetical protein